MRLMSVAILTAAAVALAAAPADAASKKRSYAGTPSAKAMRGEAGVVVRRSRTRITVTRRSYLDAGTEVYPGSMSYTDYVFPPNTRGPTDLYLPNEAVKSSLPLPFWLGAYHAPNWGY